jgi:hypothetical protein
VEDGIDLNQKQLRSRTWWSLYGLEQLLGDFTGRPTSILDSDIAIPLDFPSVSVPAPQRPQRPQTTGAAQQALLDPSPPNLHSLQASSYLYFVSRIRLSIIGHKIRSSLYSSGQMNDAWSRVQQSIRDFDQELTQWLAALPEELSLPQGVDIGSSERRGGQLLDSFELAMSYQSIRMILFRPCLCHLEGVIPHESTVSQNFSQEAAISCVSAARALLDLLPNDAAALHASKMLPWWSLLHYLTQAGAVLILELCLKAQHMPAQVAQLLRDIGKIMAWLEEMAADSLSAWRSWKIFRKLSSQAAAGVGIDVILPEDIQKPPGWKPAYEQLFSQTLSVPLHQQPNLQMSNHLQQQAGLPSVQTSSTLFPIDAEMVSAPWPLLSNIPGSTGELPYPERHAYRPSTGESAGEMDWRT